MKKIIFLLLLTIIYSEAKMEIKDLIQKDGGSYKQETESSYKNDLGSEYKKPIRKVTKTPVKKVTKTPVKKVTKTPVKKVIKTPVEKKIFKKNNTNITDKIEPKRDIKELLSLDSNDISINETIDVKTKKKLFLSDEYLESITTKVKNIWNNSIFHSGTATITLIMNTTKGKLEKIFIMNKKGSKDFKIDFKVFMKSLSTKRFMRIKSINGLIEIKIILKKQIQEKMTFDKVSIYKNKKDKMYRDYMEYLVKNKGYTVSQIKKMLHGKKNTVTKNMLYAIYADYTKNNQKEARKYYNVVINNKLDRFIKSTEGLYLADFALREGKDRLVLKILPRFSCQFMDEPEKNYCYYYRARALYHLGKEYEIPLNIVKYKLKEARIFYQDISN